jgi:serine/threonine-protein kinase
MEVIYKVIRLDPEPPQSLDRGISLEISAICLKCLEKRPADRYASALDLSEDCRRYLDGEPVLAKPVGFAKRTWRKLRRHRTLVLSLLGVALIGLASAAGVYYRYAIHPQRVAE